MATTSVRHQDREGKEPFDVDPGPSDHKLNNPEEPSYLPAQATTDCARADAEELLPETDEDLKRYRPLYRAAFNGDWESAKRFIKKNPCALTARITISSMTVLHVAANVGRSQFVEKLMEQSRAEELIKMQDFKGMTALHYAAMSGITKAAKAMVTKCPALTQISNLRGHTPILISISSSNEEMVRYLFKMTTNEPPGNPFTGPFAADLICGITTAGFHDISRDLIKRYPTLATAQDSDNYNVLRVLVGQPSAFESGSKLGFWGRCIYPFVPKPNYAPPYLPRDDMEDPPKNSRDLAKCRTLRRSVTYLTQVLQWANRLLWNIITQLVPVIKDVCDEKLTHGQATELVDEVCKQLLKESDSEVFRFFDEQAILTTATSNGIVEIVTKCLQLFPELIVPIINNRKLFHIAIKHRQEKIFNLLREYTPRGMTSAASWKFESQINILLLDLAAKLPPSSQLKCVSGSALQIQRELQWFKELRDFSYSKFNLFRNADERTAWELFMEEHKELLEKGETWMKDTSTSCMVVATLIATVVFAAAITVPGGNNSSGIPMFLKQDSFMVFAISDALALFSASTSLLTFLSILTARYAEEDFLKSLPKRLIIGLASLFFAVTTMMIAFSATLLIVFGERLKRASIPIALMACFPVALFAMLQLPLFIQMVQSTYGSGLFPRQSNLKL